MSCIAPSVPISRPPDIRPLTKGQISIPPDAIRAANSIQFFSTKARNVIGGGIFRGRSKRKNDSAVAHSTGGTPPPFVRVSPFPWPPPPPPRPPPPPPPRPCH